MKVLRITTEDTLTLRHQVLRPNAPINQCLFDGDDDELTFHLGAFVEGQLASCASFYFEKNKRFDEPYQFRLRGMATLPEYRNRGYSSELLKVAFPMIKRNLCTMLWCNARTSAENFYHKVGFEKIDDVFDIEGIGPHQLMYKTLNH